MILSNDIRHEQRARLHEIVERLHAAGRRVGPSRMAVLQALVYSGSHPGAEEIFEAARRLHPSMSRGTVYRTLDALRDAGEVLELGFHDGLMPANRYDGMRAYSHPHLICTGCGAILDLPAGGMERSLMEEAERAGFRMERYRMDLYGRCPACQCRGPVPGAASKTRGHIPQEESSNGRIARYSE